MVSYMMLFTLMMLPVIGLSFTAVLMALVDVGSLTD
jgi:hypothetical protein